MGLSIHFFPGSITISFPGMGLSGLPVQAKIEILFALCVCVWWWWGCHWGCVSAFFEELQSKSEFAPERRMRSGKSKLPVVMNMYMCIC